MDSEGERGGGEVEEVHLAIRLYSRGLFYAIEVIAASVLLIIHSFIHSFVHSFVGPIDWDRCCADQLDGHGPIDFAISD